MINNVVINVLRKKALKSVCNYKIGAIGFNRRGDYIYSSFNKPKFDRKHGSIHAEEDIMNKARSIKTILIGRVNAEGKFLPIHPCKRCKQAADKRGINIITVLDV